jgi:putative PEP-CTERM system TPR-repeat lipoprotein
VEFHANRHGEAIKLAKRIQTVAPKNPIGFVLEGDALVEEKRYPGALAAYEKALTLSPTSSIAVKVHAAQVRAGNASEADARLQKWSSEHPDDVVPLLYRAQEFQKSGKNTEAIEQYQLVLRKDPKNLLALNNLANLYQGANDPRAVATAEEAFKINPDSPAIADTLGWMLVEKGQTERGLDLLKKAAAQAPKNPEIRYHFAAALAKSGDKIQARKEIENLLASTQQFPQRKAAETLLKQL